MEITDNQIKQLQIKELEILHFFDSFCKDNNLTYYLAGGCLIGAERHQGFIPWDDDIDLFMPRPDYERLALIWNKTVPKDKYLYCRTDKYHNYHDAGASIRDVNTTFINKHSVEDDICHGIGIEIMPIDGCPKSMFSRIWQLINAALYSLFNVQRLPDNKGLFIRVLAMLIYVIFPFKSLRYQFWRFSEKQMIKYKWDECDCVTELIGAIHGMLIKHPKSDFSHVEYKEFEGFLFPVMNGYKNYLKKVWGDYMVLPPVSDRTPKHNAVLVDLNHSYKLYKGVYYCVEKHNTK